MTDWVEVFVFQGSASGELETVERRDVLEDASEAGAK